MPPGTIGIFAGGFKLSGVAQISRGRDTRRANEPHILNACVVLRSELTSRMELREGVTLLVDEGWTLFEASDAAVCEVV